MAQPLRLICAVTLVRQRLHDTNKVITHYQAYSLLAYSPCYVIHVFCSEEFPILTQVMWIGLKFDTKPIKEEG